VSLQTGETLKATMQVDAAMATTHEVVGYLRVSENWIDLGTSAVDPAGNVTVPATFTEPGTYFMRIIVKQKPMVAMGFASSSFVSDQVMLIAGQALELEIVVTGQALELTTPTPEAYSGPILENTPQRVSSAGGEVSFTGKNLDSVSDAFVLGVAMRVISATSDALVIEFTALEPATYSLQLSSDYGLLTVQDALIVSLDALEYTGPGSFVTKKISDTEIKIYAKDIIGLGKVQFMVNGKEIAWIRAKDGTDPKLRVVVLADGDIYYLVRTVELDQRLRIEILVDGQRAKFATYNPS
jgi:hypothetical protein